MKRFHVHVHYIATTTVWAETHGRALDAFERWCEAEYGRAVPDECSATVTGAGEARGYVNPYGWWERDDDVLEEYA